MKANNTHMVNAKGEPMKCSAANNTTERNKSKKSDNIKPRTRHSPRGERERERLTESGDQGRRLVNMEQTDLPAFEAAKGPAEKPQGLLR